MNVKTAFFKWITRGRDLYGFFLPKVKSAKFVSVKDQFTVLKNSLDNNVLNLIKSWSLIVFKMTEEDHYVNVIRSEDNFTILSLYVDGILLAVNNVKFVKPLKNCYSQILKSACLYYIITFILNTIPLICSYIL